MSWHRNTRAAAERLARRLRARGGPVELIRAPGGLYRLDGRRYRHRPEVIACALALGLIEPRRAGLYPDFPDAYAATRKRRTT